MKGTATEENLSAEEKLFVYGTLAPGRPNEHILKPLGGSWQPASIQGRLSSQGWGSAVGYPGLFLDETADSIQGLLFTALGLPAFWEELDAFEGDGYQRTLTNVRLLNGELVQCYVYQLRSVQ